MWGNTVPKLTSKLQIANQKRWSEEGHVKRSCALFRNMIVCGKDSFTPHDYVAAMTQVNIIETILLSRIRNDYERVKDGLKRTSESSKKDATK